MKEERGDKSYPAPLIVRRDFKGNAAFLSRALINDRNNCFLRSCQQLLL